MKIQTIEFENFRNFREHGKIECSEDGITIIYGKNGDGKTTLHQLLQWIIYGNVNFNKTASEHLYNFDYEKKVGLGKTFEVMGRIDFEHEGENYSLMRVNKYKKELSSSKKVSQDFYLQKLTKKDDWKKVVKPGEFIEKVLPSGLSEYFFFDGESMIADLRVKGKDSAMKLRKSLFSMFELDILEHATEHIGRTDLKTTALGKLYLSKGMAAHTGDIAVLQTNINNVQNKIQELKDEKSELVSEKKEKKKAIKEVSETIGNTPSKEEYEKERKTIESNRDAFLKALENQKELLGSAIITDFPRLLISKSVLKAEEKIDLEISKSNFPSGLTKELIHYLIEENDECICGNKINKNEKDHIKKWLEMMPPNNYESVHKEFVTNAKRIKGDFDEKKYNDYLKDISEISDKAENCDIQIKRLDDEQKNSPDIEELVIAREQAEERINEIDDSINEIEKLLLVEEAKLRKLMSKYDELTDNKKTNDIVNRKIKILEEVSKYFVDKLSKESKVYSKKLESNIQELLNKMLTSKRKVSVSQDFSVRVTDSHGDESKSEGQFAVVSFAYIGGILQMLQAEKELRNKEYPLVLDGPFSKLDADQRQNVADELSSFAPQVILFSKDDLRDVINDKDVGRVWTIVSNDEKNDAEVKEGMLWK